MANPYWFLVIPAEKTNLITNPSAERNTTGWSDPISGFLSGRKSDAQAFGAWSMASNAGVINTPPGGLGIGPFTAGVGTAYTVSLYMRSSGGDSIRFGVANNADVLGAITYSGTTIVTVGGGTWHRHNLSYTEASGGARYILVQSVAGLITGTIYMDGAQAEVGSITTYADGDQDGCYWTGAPHNSASVRSGTYRGGGSVVSLASLGFSVDQMPGVGMPPVQNTSQSFALLDGGEFQRQRAKERSFILTGRLGGTTQTDYHITRQRVIDALKIDLVSPQQRTRFWYTGGPGTVCIDAVYDAGLEGNQDLGKTGFGEDAKVRFVAHNPMWYATTDQGTTLAPRVSLGSTNYIARRDPLGRWGTMGIAGTTVDVNVQSLLFSNGTLFLGGQSNKAGGTTSGALAMYDPVANRFGTMGGTVQAGGGVQALATDALGTLYFGGALTGISGLTNTRFIAQWTSAGFGTIKGGTPSDYVTALTYNAGTLFVGGNFLAVAGTTTFIGVGQWTTVGYGSLTGGTINGKALALVPGLDGRLFITGDTFTTAGGTTVNYITQWNGAFGSLGTGFMNGVGGGGAVAVAPSGILYAGGAFGSAGGGSAQNIAQWNGVQWTAMAGGVGNLNPGLIVVTSITVDQTTGDAYAAWNLGAKTGARTLPDLLGRWNGYIWLPLDIDFQGNAPSVVLKTPDQTLYIGGAMSGTATAASVGQIYNVGRADTYPVLKARLNASSGTARIYQFVNTLTGDGVFFDYVLQPAEEVVLDLTPGARSFTSSIAGNIFGRILGGSNIASLRLLAGTNWISFFSDNDSVLSSVYWRPRSPSSDAGTNL